MPYKYADDSNQPFVLVNLDPFEELGLDDGVDLIAASEVYPAPLLLRRLNSGFGGDIDVLPVEKRQISDLARMLYTFQFNPEPARFVVAFDLGDGEAASGFLKGHFDSIIGTLRDQGRPAKKLIMVTKNGDPRKFFDGHVAGEGTIVPLPAAPNVSSSQLFSRFESAVKEPAPSGDEP